MLPKRNAQAGVTILQVLLGITVGTLLFVEALNATIQRNRQSTFNDAVVLAQNVALQAERNANRVTGTVPSPNWRFTYTFNGRTGGAFRDSALLAVELNTPMVTVTPYDTAIEYMSGTGPGQARFTVPEDDARRIQPNNGEYATEVLPSGDLRVTVMTPYNVNLNTSRSMRQVKHFFFEERTR